MATAKDPEIQALSHVIRNVVANLNIAFPEHDELRFRTSIISHCVELIPDLSPSHVTRLYEAACEVKFASEDVKDFRDKLQRSIGKSLNLARFKPARKA